MCGANKMTNTQRQNDINRATRVPFTIIFQKTDSLSLIAVAHWQTDGMGGIAAIMIQTIPR